MNYEACLRIFKESLDGGSEYPLIVDGIVRSVNTYRIRWLDVGIGNGRYTKKIIDALRARGFEVELDAIEPNKESIKKTKKLFPHARLYNCSIEEFEFEKKYDVVNLCQSLYYLQDPTSSIHKIIKHLAGGGLLLAILWTKNDVLYKIHKEVFTDASLTAEESMVLFKQLEGFSNVSMHRFRGTVNLEQWRKLGKDLPNVFKIISRYPLKKNVTALSSEYLLGILSQYPEVSVRENGVVICKKAYSFPSVDIKNLMKRKFPSEKLLATKLSGDKEALFMCSWEKEGDYLSKRVAGPVLDLCCGVGGRTIIVSRRHKVTGIDNNKKRVAAARKNAVLFKATNASFLVGDVCDKNIYLDIGPIRSILIDADWRENMTHPLKKHSLNPLLSTPRLDVLYKLLRKVFPKALIIFKISPYSDVSRLTALGHCLIEEMYLENTFLAYNVYFYPSLKRNIRRSVYL